MGISVFISYSHKQGNIVNRFKQKLAAHRIQVWIDHERLPPGTRDWDDAIRKGIQAVDFVLYMASPDALQSKIAQGELDVAEDLMKQIVPIWVAGDKFTQCVPLRMTKAQYIDAKKSRFDLALNELLKTLRKFDNSLESVDKSPPVNNPSPPPPISVRTAVSPQDMVTSPPLVKRIVATPIIQNRPAARNLGTFIGGCLGIILGAYIGGAIVGPQLSVGVLGSTGGISGSRSVGLDFGVLIGCILGLIIGAFIYRFMDHDHTDTNTAKIVSRTFGVGLFGLIFGSIVGGVAGGTIGSIVGSDIGVICGGIIGSIIGYFSD